MTIVRTRLDQYLVDQGLVESRNIAQQMITSGQIEIFVRSKWIRAVKASQKIDIGVQIRLSDGPVGRFVSRAGLKLEAALERTKLTVRGIRVLDIGQSTGGFTDCLLQCGVSEVVGVEVGESQLHPKIRQNPRVVSLENCNARQLSGKMLLNMNIDPQFDLVVVDVSFISLEKILPAVSAMLKKQAYLLALVKPQFEAETKTAGKISRLNEPQVWSEVETRIRSECARLGLKCADYFPSAVEGSDGVQEFFIFCVNN